MKTIQGYKFVTDELRSKNEKADWEVGVWKEFSGKLETVPFWFSRF